MAIFLDLDNTILPSKPAYDYAIKQLAFDWENKGIGSNEEFTNIYLSSREIVKKQLLHHTSNRLRLLCFKHMLAEKNSGISTHDMEFLLWLEDRYYFHFETSLQNAKSNDPNWQSLISYLEKLFQKHSVWILTNETLRTQLMKLKAFFPPSIKWNLITSEEIGLEKPDSNYFNYALRISGSLPNKTFMVGDNLEDDIFGASKCGIHAIHLLSIFGEDKQVKEVNGKGNTHYHSTSNIYSAIEFGLNRFS
ncbi:MAG: HAD family hydrolase [Leptospira sp.]|nr:HAD family hydrolase [Leptospira sp.]